MITTIIGHNRELLNLVKIYTDNIKYSVHNDSFIFKLIIFHNISFRADVLFKAKMETFSIMLKILVPDNYSSNIGISDTVINSI